MQKIVEASSFEYLQFQAKLIKEENDELLSKVVRIHNNATLKILKKEIFNKRLPKTLKIIFPSYLSLFTIESTIKIENLENFIENLKILKEYCKEKDLKKFLLRKVDLEKLKSTREFEKLFRIFKKDEQIYIYPIFEDFSSKKLLEILKKFNIYPSRVEALKHQGLKALESTELSLDSRKHTLDIIDTIFDLAYSSDFEEFLKFLEREKLPVRLYNKHHYQLAYYILNNSKIKNIEQLQKLTKLGAHWRDDPETLSEILNRINSREFFEYFLKLQAVTLKLLYLQAIYDNNFTVIDTLVEIDVLNKRNFKDIIKKAFITKSGSDYEKGVLTTLYEFLNYCCEKLGNNFKKALSEVCDELLDSRKETCKYSYSEIEVLKSYLNLNPSYENFKNLAESSEEPREINTSLIIKIAKKYPSMLKRSKTFQEAYIKSVLYCSIKNPELKISEKEIILAAQFILKNKFNIYLSLETQALINQSNKLSVKSKRILSSFSDFEKLKSCLSRFIVNKKKRSI